MREPTLETLAEQWRHGMEHAAAAFRHKHVKEYRTMLDGTMGEYKATLGEFDRRMQQLDRACAFANGWPAFDLWLQEQQPATAA